MKLSERAKRYVADNDQQWKAVVFKQLIDAAGDKEIADYTRSDILSYLTPIVDKGAVNTYNHRLAVLRKFFAEMEDEDRSLRSPCRGIKNLPVEVRAPEDIGTDKMIEAQQAARHVALRSHLNLRNELIVVLMFSLGLRAEEVCRIIWGQIDLGQGLIRKLRTKGSKFRTFPLTPECVSAIKRYTAKRALELGDHGVEWDNPNYPLVVSTYRATPGKPETFKLSKKGVWRVIHSIGEEIGEAKLHPHALRHTFAHRMLEATGDIRLVQRALGHSSVQTTMRYLGVEEEEVNDGVQKAAKLWGVLRQAERPEDGPWKVSEQDCLARGDDNLRDGGGSSEGSGW